MDIEEAFTWANGFFFRQLTAYESGPLIRTSKVSRLITVYGLQEQLRNHLPGRDNRIEQFRNSVRLLNKHTVPCSRVGLDLTEVTRIGRSLNTRAVLGRTIMQINGTEEDSRLQHLITDLADMQALRTSAAVLIEYSLAGDDYAAYRQLLEN